MNIYYNYVYLHIVNMNIYYNYVYLHIVNRNIYYNYFLHPNINIYFVVLSKNLMKKLNSKIYIELINPIKK